MGEADNRLPSDRVNRIVRIGLLFGVGHAGLEKLNGRVKKNWYR
jgi:hypothetical protein